MYFSFFYVPEERKVELAYMHMRGKGAVRAKGLLRAFPNGWTFVMLCAIDSDRNVIKKS